MLEAANTVAIPAWVALLLPDGVDVEADATSGDFAVRWQWELAHSPAWTELEP